MFILIGVVVALAVAFFVLSQCHSTAPSGQTASNTEQVVIGGEKFQLELASDDQARQLGLMNRTQIPDHGGMLFVFPDSKVIVQEFWMGNCLVDMDIVYLDRRGFITAMHHMKMEPPRGADESEAAYDRRMPRYSSAYPAQFAIELKAGTLERLNLHVEQKIDLDIPHLKSMAR